MLCHAGGRSVACPEKRQSETVFSSGGPPAHKEESKKEYMTTAQYNQCVDLYADGVYRFILKNLRDDDKSRDVVQDSFEKLWLRHREVSFEKARSYLFTTAYRAMIDTIRKDKYQTPLEEEFMADQGYSQEYSGLKEILDKALSLLTPDQRSVILLRDYEGYSYQEIGKITGLSESQVKVYIYRARVFLKRHIGSMDAVI